jgi:hypothetical protein
LAAALQTLKKIVANVVFNLLRVGPDIHHQTTSTMGTYLPPIMRIYPVKNKHAEKKTRSFANGRLVSRLQMEG